MSATSESCGLTPIFATKEWIRRPIKKVSALRVRVRIALLA